MQTQNLRIIAYVEYYILVAITHCFFSESSLLLFMAGATTKNDEGYFEFNETDICMNLKGVNDDQGNEYEKM